MGDLVNLRRARKRRERERDAAVAAENRVVALQQGDERHALVVRIVRR